MEKMVRLLVSGAFIACAAGCATQQQQLAAKQPAAIDTALARGRFEMNCPTATATVLSQDFIQPAIQGPWVAGLQRAEYTIGIEGCNQRRTYVIMCQEGTETCFAASPMAGRFDR